MSYTRKTRDVYKVEGYYCGEWCELTTEDNRTGAVETCKCYDENERAPHRIRKCRVYIERRKS